jgi:hypothetical protein
VDSGFIVRPPSRTAQPIAKASDGVSVREAVAASLSAAQAVTPAAKSAEVRAEDNSNVHKIVLDAQSREVIQEVLDVARRAARQAPEDTKQRLRAYVRRTPSRRAQSKDGLDLEV